MIVKIGVTGNARGVHQEYLDAVAETGAKPIVLRNDPARVAADLAQIDGLLLTGGTDVDPAHYGEEPHAATDRPDDERDAYELALVRAARERDLPMLAICRGAQVANVAFGGTLVQHLPDHASVSVPHRIDGVRGVIAAHVVEIDAGSRLAAVLGTTRLATSARHHQAVARVAADLRAVGTTADGVIEAVEAGWPARFFLAVQWHPESTLDDGGPSRALFRALTDAARDARHPALFAATHGG